MRIIETARKRILNGNGVNPFFLDLNGSTIRLKTDQGFGAGSVGLADFDSSGKVYTAVDQTAWDLLDPSTDDYTVICTTLVTDMNNAFYDIDFNQNISHFDTSNVTNMSFMFGFETFASGNSNVNITLWDVSKVLNFSGMFRSNTAFNKDISLWNTSSATDMSRMFGGADSFNIDISQWDVSSVIDMNRMFNQNDVFNQDLTGWCVEQILIEPPFFAEPTFLPANRPLWGTIC